MEKFGKRKINIYGQYLLELARRNDLVLTDTLFNHKVAHRAMWVCPDRVSTANKKFGVVK